MGENFNVFLILIILLLINNNKIKYLKIDIYKNNIIITIASRRENIRTIAVHTLVLSKFSVSAFRFPESA